MKAYITDDTSYRCLISAKSEINTNRLFKGGEQLSFKSITVVTVSVNLVSYTCILYCSLNPNFHILLKITIYGSPVKMKV